MFGTRDCTKTVALAGSIPAANQSTSISHTLDASTSGDS